MCKQGLHQFPLPALLSANTVWRAAGCVSQGSIKTSSDCWIEPDSHNHTLLLARGPNEFGVGKRGYVEAKQHVQVDLALPQHLGNLTSIPCSTPRLLWPCRICFISFCPACAFRQRNLNEFPKALRAMWPNPCCRLCFQRANVPVIGKRLRSDCSLFRRQMSVPHLNRGLALALCSLYSTGYPLSFRKKENNPYMPERQMQNQNTFICLG